MKRKREKGSKSRVTNSGSGWDDVSWGEGLALSFWLQRKEEDITRNTIQKILNPTKHLYDMKQESAVRSRIDPRTNSFSFKKLPKA